MGIEKFDDEYKAQLEEFSKELDADSIAISEELNDKVSKIESFVLSSIDNSDPKDLAKQTYKMILQDRRAALLIIDKLQIEAETNPMLYMFVQQLMNTLVKNTALLVKMQENMIKKQIADKMFSVPDEFSDIGLSDSELLALQKSCHDLGIEPEGFSEAVNRTIDSSSDPSDTSD